MPTHASAFDFAARPPALLEVCADSYASAMAAVRGGADRIELCSALVIGGLTPSPALLEQLRAQTKLPIRCLMRPRFGDFLYTEEEIDQMCREIHLLKERGASGFVVGCLTAGGALDEAKTARLIEAAGGKSITLHRAFDVCADADAALCAAARLGIDTVLTSGLSATCREGLDTISRLLQNDHGRNILIGSGVNAAVIAEVRAALPAARQFHLSAKCEKESGMHFRREGVPMGLPGLSEYTIYETDEAAVRAAKQALSG